MYTRRAGKHGDRFQQDLSLISFSLFLRDRWYVMDCCSDVVDQPNYFAKLCRQCPDKNYSSDEIAAAAANGKLVAANQMATSRLTRTDICSASM
jgi:hypothetical protein